MERGKEEHAGQGRRKKEREEKGARAVDAFQGPVGFGATDWARLSASTKTTVRPGRVEAWRRGPSTYRLPRGRVGPVGFDATDWVIFLKKIKTRIIFGIK